MKVTGNDPSKVNDLSLSQAKSREKSGQAQAGNTQGAGSTSAEMPAQGLTTQRMRDAVKSEPDVRSAKVAELKAKIKGGEYQVDDARLAQNLLSSALKEDIKRN